MCSKKSKKMRQHHIFKLVRIVCLVALEKPTRAMKVDAKSYRNPNIKSIFVNVGHVSAVRRASGSFETRRHTRTHGVSSKVDRTLGDRDGSQTRPISHSFVGTVIGRPPVNLLAHSLPLNHTVHPLFSSLFLTPLSLSLLEAPPNILND